MFRANNSYVCV